MTNQRRSSQEDGSLLPHDDALISHGRYIRSSGSAGAHNNSNLQKNNERIKSGIPYFNMKLTVNIYRYKIKEETCQPSLE